MRRILAGLALVAAGAPLAAQPPPDTASIPDAVQRLQARLVAGETALAYDSIRGWLPALLAALDVPVSSQVLVFSRTSLQTDLISPWAPRAVYFDDDVYVGWAQESPIVELAVVDPDDGASFYTLAQDPDREPSFTRESTTCLMCHESRAVTGGVAGFIVRSVLTDRFGYPMVPLHEGSTTDRTPFDQRFGGYYVSGPDEAVGHAGNALAPVESHEVTDPRRYLRAFDLRGEQATAGPLDRRFDVEPYLARHSDLVALLVLTHQAHVHNLIATARTAGAEAIREERLFDEVSAAARLRVEGAVEALLRAMLFADEVPLPAPVAGSSSFRADFEARGPFDARGRSLRTFDLERRLFAHRLSFLVHSEAFRTLPKDVREPFFARLAAGLSGSESGRPFEHLTPDERRAIAEILTATEPDFAAVWSGG